MYVEPACDAIVDANGTDFFELWGQSSTGSTGWSGFFLAFPLTGMQGPMGLVGSIGQMIRANFGVGAVPPGGGWTALGFTLSSNDTGVAPASPSWTPPLGRWLVSGNFQFTGANASDCGAGIGIGGTITNSNAVAYSAVAGAHVALCVSDVIDFNGSTALSWMGQCTSATTTLQAQSWWSATRIK